MTLLVIHAAATWFMVGLIWMTQLVHYPLFAQVGTAAFVDYEREHTRRMAGLLAVPALTEIVTGGLLVWRVPDGASLSLVLGAGALLAAIWVMTAFVHAPLHGKLSARFDVALVHRLVAANWWRTAAWSLRGVLVAAMF